MGGISLGCFFYCVCADSMGSFSVCAIFIRLCGGDRVCGAAPRAQKVCVWCGVVCERVDVLTAERLRGCKSVRAGDCGPCCTRARGSCARRERSTRAWR